MSKWKQYGPAYDQLYDAKDMMNAVIDKIDAELPELTVLDLENLKTVAFMLFISVDTALMEARSIAYPVGTIYVPKVDREEDSSGETDPMGLN